MWPNRGTEFEKTWAILSYFLLHYSLTSFYQLSWQNKKCASFKPHEPVWSCINHRQQHGAHSDRFVLRKNETTFLSWLHLCPRIYWVFFSVQVIVLDRETAWLLMWMWHFWFLHHCENEKIPETPFRISQMPLTHLYGPMHPEQKKRNCA